MQLDLNTLINLGVLAAIAWVIRAVIDIRLSVQAIKTTLGINGSDHPGLVQEVQSLRDAKHEHANDLHALNLEVALLKQAKDSQP